MIIIHIMWHYTAIKNKENLHSIKIEVGRTPKHAVSQKAT